ncbi:MAG: PepSY domain-containing protein [Synergistaceae bacterium]|jgi:uncharacterized membrane protein YkoI|nr:PepSY domain-containing protein [Synergistaceae bacterium]
MAGNTQRKSRDSFRFRRAGSKVVFFLLIFVFFGELSTWSFAAAYIGESSAKSIALKHAGLSESEAKVVKLALYDKHRTVLYDIEFLSAGAKYSYEINAVSGEVMAYYRKDRAVSDENNGDRGSDIGSEKAKSIAFSHAKVSESGVYEFELKLTEKKGVRIYKIDFEHGNMEYEYEIDASTGAILRFKAERD